MKKFKQWKKERGDIALIAIFATLVFLILMAVVIDGGLLYYRSAKLQNAVDSAVVAVAQHMDADDGSQDYWAKYYLKQNGFDKDEYGDKMDITIEQKGTLEDQFAEENEDAYISDAYIKLNVKITTSGIFGMLSGYNNITGDKGGLNKSGYAKIDVNYVEMPRALTYTIFGGNTTTTNRYQNMTVQLNGRADGNLTTIVNGFTNVINGINNKIIQPIIDFVGGTGNYNDLISPALSTAITNGDVHSNSDINIGVQTLNASRTKDAIYDGDNAQCTCISTCVSTNVDTTCVICRDDYVACEGDTVRYDDYNQVTYTAVGNIYFSNAKAANSSFISRIFGAENDKNSHVYVQNQQYLEQTQVALNIINTMDFVGINSTTALKSAYTEAADTYLAAHHRISDDQKDAIKAQVNNLQYNSNGTYSLFNQNMIVYDVTNNTANKVMTDMEGRDGMTVSDLLQEVIDAGIDKTHTMAPHVALDSIHHYDSASSEANYNIVFTKTKNSSTATLEVNGAQVTNRNVKIMSPMQSETVAGYRFAVARTFQELSDYVDIPNMKPYFVRQINRSVKNATTNKDSGSDSSTESATSIKKAVANAQKEMSDFIDTKNVMGAKKGTVVTDDEKANGTYSPEKTNVYTDNKYASDTALTSQDTSPLFRYNLKQKVVGGDNNSNANNLVLTEYGNNDAGHTTFRGESLYENGVLRTPEKFINEYKTNNASKYGKDAVQKFFNDHINGKFGASKIATERAYVAANKSYQAFSNSITEKNFSDTAPAESDVFLTEGFDVTTLNSVPGKKLDAMLKTEHSGWPGASMTGVESQTVTIHVPDVSGIGNASNSSYADPSVSIDKTITIGANTYKMKDLVWGTPTAKSAVETFRNAQPKLNPSDFGYKGTINVGTKSGNQTNGDKDYMFWLEDGYAYNRMNEKKNGIYKMGFRVRSGAKAQLNGFYASNLSSIGYRGTVVQSDAQLYIRANDSDYHPVDGVKYKYYNADNNSEFILESNSFVYIDGNAYQKCTEKDYAINIGSGATMYVNGNLLATGGKKGALKMGPNSKLIVTGWLDTRLVEADASSTVICQSLKSVDDAGLTFGNLYVADSVNVRKLTVHGSCNFVAGGALSTNGKDLKFNDGDKVVVGGAMSYGSISTPGAYSLCANSDFNFAGKAITVNSGQLLAANSLTIDNTTVNGEMYATGAIAGSDASKKLTVSSTGKVLAGSINANLDNSGKIIVTSFGDANKDKTITNSGNLKINVNSNCKSVTNHASGSMCVAGNLTTAESIINYGVFKAKNVTTGTTFTNDADCVFQATGTMTIGTNMTNSGQIKCGSKITVAGILTNSTNSSIIQATAVEAVYISNNGQIRCSGDISASGNITSGSGSYIIANSLYTTTFYQNGVTYIDTGDLITRAPGDGETDPNIGLLQITGSIYVITGKVNVGGNIIGYSSATLFAGGDIRVAGSITFDHGVIKTDGELDASEITANGTLMQFGNITVSSVWTISEGGKAFVEDDLTAFKIENRGTIYLKKTKMNVKTLRNYSTGVVICDGNLNVTSFIDSENRESVLNEGEIYVNGNFSAEHRIHNRNGKIYVRGDMTACNATVYAGLSDKVTSKQTFNFEGSSQIYVSGWLNSEGLTKGVYVTGTGNGTVISIYGRGHKTCFGSHINYFDNDQIGSRIYLGTGSGWEAIQEGRKVSISGQFDNDGQMFIYGNLYSNEEINLGGNSTSFTKACGDVTETLHSINISKGHKLIAFNNISCTVANIAGDSQMYGMNGCKATSKYNIKTTGLVYCGPNSEAVSKLTITSDGNFKGKMYYPGSGSSVKLDVPTTFDGGTLAITANISFANLSNITLTNGAVVCVDGTSNLGAYNFVNTSGEMYLMGNVNINSFTFRFNSGCINFIGPLKIGTSGTRGTIEHGQAIDWNGVNYFDNSFVETCNDSVEKNFWGTITGPAGGEIIDDPVVRNRYVAIRINSGETHFSGNLTVANTGLATRVATGAALSCNNLNIRSVIYNQGSLVVCNELNYDCSSGAYSDKGDDAYDQGYCIRNGWSDSDQNAMMYIGSNKDFSIRGSFQSHGKFYANSNSFWVHGYNIPGDKEFNYRTLVGQYNDSNHNTTRHAGKEKNYAPHFSIQTGRNSVTQFAGSVSTHATIWTGVDSVFGVETDLGYGQAVLNGGKFYVKNSIGYSSDPYAVNNIQLIYTTTDIVEDIKGSVSIANGFVENSIVANDKAEFYCGSSLQTGTVKDSSDDKRCGGAVQNWGKMYVNGDMNVYTCTTANKMGVNMVGITTYVGAKTFVKGHTYTGGGFVTELNSIFMTGSDLESKRCARIGCPEVLSGDDDVDSSSYCYVGRDMMTSTNGAAGNGDIGVPNSTWNYFMAFSNANIYVGNAFFTNSITVPKRNTTFAIDGKYDGNGQTYRGIFANLQAAIIEAAFRIQGSSFDDVKFTVIGDSSTVGDTAELGFEENGNKSQFYHLIVRGSAYVKNTFRFRDMSDAYIYGDFLNYSNNTAKNVEIGKSMSFSETGDDTWAAQGTFKTARDLERTDPNFDYNYEHAGYFYVKGDFKTRGRLSVYAGTTLKIGGNCQVRHKIQLSHDGNIFVGGDLRVPGSANIIKMISGTGFIDAEEYSNIMVRGDITAGNYIIMRENSLLFCGKKVKAATSFEAKTAATVFVCGSLEATLNTIKIRDESQVFVGGNMTALRYIELGKFDENYVDSRGDVKRKDDEELGASCICETRCSAANEECPVCKDHYGDCAVESSCTCTDQCSSQDVANERSCSVCRSDYQNCMKQSEVAKNALGDEVTDKANGGIFYIGKTLSSYTGYIREYGFSRVCVGKYTFAMNYITLRSNADMWVLPEAFANDTYRHIAYVSESDGSILGNIIDKIREAAYNVRDALTLKNGSVYSLGELTLNKNASLLGTWDCYAYDQTLMSHDALVYFGHDFNCYAASLQIDFSSKTPLVGFSTQGKTYSTLTCPNKNTKKHGKFYTMYCDNYSSSKSYKCDRCGTTIPTSKIKHNITCPVTIYANHDVNIITTIDMKLTYIVASQGDVTMRDVYSNTDNIEGNIKQLPNAIGSFNGNINYFAMYGKICSLFYAPTGLIDLDGYYQEIWGSCIGDKVTDNVYYLNMHRFQNWKTMDLQVAEAGDVYLISEREWNEAQDAEEHENLYSYNAKDESEGGASLFFPAEFLENKGGLTGGETGSENTGLTG